MRAPLLVVALLLAAGVAGSEPQSPDEASEDDDRWHIPRKGERELERDEPQAYGQFDDRLGSWKSALRERGIQLDVDMALYYQGASDVVSGEQHVGTFAFDAVGDWRLFKHARWGGGFVQWELLGSPGLNYDTTDQNLTKNVGSISNLNANVDPDPAALNEVAWKQVLLEENLILALGRLDLSNYFDTNRAANDGFRQFVADALQNNQSIPFPDYGGLGAGVHVGRPDRLYVAVGAGDSAADEPFAFWKTLDQDSWYVLVELGASPHWGPLGSGTFRVIPWYNHKSGKDGWGVGLGFDQELGLERLVAFFRFGIGDQDVTDVERFVSGGVSLSDPFGRADDEAGLGVAWSDPSPGEGFRDETLVELYYRLAIFPSLTLSPDLQIVLDPGNNTQNDIVVVGGIRLELRF